MTNEDDLKELDELELEPHDGEDLQELTGEGLSTFDEETDLLAEPMTPLDAPIESAAAPLPEGAGLVAEGAAYAADAGAGQWVWQYGAPAPPPSFGAVFFSGSAVSDLYRRFACALLVVIGCLLPWGSVETLTDVAEGAPTFEIVHAPGIDLPLGALSFVLGLWLLFSSCYGIYTSRQKILPVFLMIEPTVVSWSHASDAWSKVAADGLLDKLTEFAGMAGTGVLLTLVGSTWVAGGFLFLFVKVFAKKDDDKGAARRAARGAKDEASPEAPAADDDKKAARRGRKR